MKKTILLSAFAASALLAGCGGGGGGNSGGGNPAPVSTPLRALVARNFVYDQVGSLTTTTGGMQALTTSSQRTLVVTTGTTAGRFKLDETDALVVDENSPSTALNLDAEVTQQGDRTLVLRSLDLGDGIKTLSNATRVYLPGLFTENTAASNQTLSFTDGSSATYSFKVNGRESVTVPFGTFTAYVVNVTLTFTNTNKRIGTYYYVPELGTYVKSVETITRPNGNVAVVTSNLRTAS